MIGSALLGPLLACGYFLNGGVGMMMQPAPSGGSGPPPGSNFIVTQTGSNNLVTQTGAKFITG